MRRRKEARKEGRRDEEGKGNERKEWRERENE